MPLQATSGAASYDAFGGGVPVEPNYIESVFSTWLYTGNGSTQTITNGIDLAGEGGLVWIKSRSNSFPHVLDDTNSGVLKSLSTNNTFQQFTELFGITAFNSNGFAMNASNSTNDSGATFASWTFRKAPKFFDVVTYTGNGAGFKIINHSLGSAPGFVVIKRTDAAGDWYCARRDASQNWTTGRLNSTAAMTLYYDSDGVDATTQINVNRVVDAVGAATTVNISGATYVAYLFAHNAGGFGLTGTDNVITCGAYTGNGSATGPVITLGYEPQWLMVKNASGTGNWNIIDNMRGMTVGGTDAFLEANTIDAEATADWVSPTATGFQVTSSSSEVNTSSSTYIYIAIRRGPMKVPTTGTSVFAPLVINAATGTSYTTGFPIDSQWTQNRNASTAAVIDRLRFASTTASSGGFVLGPAGTSAEINLASARNWGSTGGQIPSGYENQDRIFWNFRRAPGFFDEVCYTGTGSATTFAHNLAAVPELMIVKKRSGTGDWYVYSAFLGNTDALILQLNIPALGSTASWNNTTPTTTTFTLGNNSQINASGATGVAYLFATCPGVSKVGSYTGNGTTQAIACGFTGGARFVLIKRTDSTGDWYVYDTARGMTVLTDPYLWMNSGNAEVATLGSVTTTTGGFTVDAAILAAINTNAASYVFLAIS
jgi:hypothetical protein